MLLRGRAGADGQVWVVALSWVVMFLWVLRPIWDIDIFFHIAIGREVLANGIPSTDLFSAATPDAPWTPFQTGYEVLVAVLDGVGGLGLVRVFHALLVTAGLCILAWRCQQISGNRSATFVLMALALFLYDDRILCRPHVLNLVLEAGVLIPLAAGRWRTAPARWLRIVAGSALVWGMVHAMGALWLIAVLGAQFVAGPDRAARVFALKAGAIAIVAVLLAPGALGGIWHVLSIQGQWAEFVPELAPSWSWFGEGHVYGYCLAILPWIALAITIVAAARRPVPERRTAVLVAIGLASGSVLMARLGYYAAIAMALVVPEIASLFRRVRPLVAAGVGAGLLLLLMSHVVPRWVGVNPWTTTIYPGHFPEQEAQLLRHAGIEGRIWNETEWGGYLLYALYPPSTVLSDGRITFGPRVRELLIADQRRSSRRLVADAAHEWFKVDLLIRRHNVFPGGEGWKLLMRGPVAEVWSHAGPVAAQRRQKLLQAQASLPK